MTDNVPLRRLLEQYCEAVERERRARQLSSSWEFTMEAYAKRFVAWYEGNPDWSRLTSRDSIDRRYPP